jgi:hypothetical protein
MIAHRPWLGVSTRDWFINSDTPQPKRSCYDPLTIYRNVRGDSA